MAQAVVQAYGKWWVAHHQRLSWDEGLKVHEKFVQQVGRRVDIGVSAIIDLGLAEGRLSATLAERNLALAQEQIALDDLKFLTKIDSLNLTAEAQLPAVSLEFVAYNRLLDAALSNSISLKQAKARAEKAEAEQDAQQASIWPQLYLQAERQIGNFSQTNVNNDTTVFVVFSSQLNAGLSFQSNNEASEATYTAALEQVNGEEQNVARQLRSSLTLIASFNKRQIALNAARGKSKQVYQSFNRQFTEGLKDWQELLNSARELVQSDVQWAQTYGQYLVASWQLQLDTQGLSFLAEGT
jgi:adhesin transport system outer membrane protein